MIELKDASFEYANGNSGALEEVSLTIGDGECVLLCGESGCGKTTLTRLINGLIPHYYEGKLSGSISVSGLNTLRNRSFTKPLVMWAAFFRIREASFSALTPQAR